ncbi:MAG: hypothetical protein MUO76_12570, partial [Anaerolineaceae bacterium]|nr:hypothetical protein [Anaerolineaceae bacterium]
MPIALWRHFPVDDQTAQGLASATIAQVIIVKAIPRANEIVNIVFAVIMFTIILNSISIFMLKHSQTKRTKDKS